MGYVLAWQDFRSHVRRADRIGREVILVMIRLKVLGAVRLYLWGVDGMTIDEMNEPFICHKRDLKPKRVAGLLCIDLRGCTVAFFFA